MTINCRGNLIDLSQPKVMGILNLTPDSFYDGGRFKDESNVLDQVQKMLSEGATFIDIGAYSSRPGADFVSEDEELNRITLALKSILKEFEDVNISIDTFRSKVAKTCIEMGAAIINDISAGDLDANMMKSIAQYQVPYIMMHMRGNPKTMQQKTDYQNVVTDVIKSLSEKVQLAQSKGINDLIIDPGFGFSKTTTQNYELLKNLELFKGFDLPILVGLSRKSMIYKVLKTTPENALNGTSILNTIALLKGANILRVHDVRAAIECVRLVSKVDLNKSIQGLH